MINFWGALLILLSSFPLFAAGTVNVLSANPTTTPAVTPVASLEEALNAVKNDSEAFLRFSEGLKKMGMSPERAEEILKNMPPEQQQALLKMAQKQSETATGTVTIETTRVFIPASQDNAPVNFSNFSENALASFREIPEDELRKFIIEALATRFDRAEVEKYPRLINFVVALLKDKEALPSFLRLSQKRKQLIYFSIFFFITVGISAFWTHRQKKKDRPFLAMVGHALFRSSVMNVLRLGVFYFAFESELRPLFSLISKTFFGPH